VTLAVRRCLVLGLGSALGYGLWVVWSQALGKGLPLDGGAKYLGCLFVAGASLCMLEPEEPWLPPLGVYLGQAAALAFETALGLAGDPAVFPLRLLYLVSITLAAVLGAAVTAGLRNLGRMA
jgi:hypothetical protein